VAGRWQSRAMCHSDTASQASRASQEGSRREGKDGINNGESTRSDDGVVTGNGGDHYLLFAGTRRNDGAPNSVRNDGGTKWDNGLDVRARRVPYDDAERRRWGNDMPRTDDRVVRRGEDSAMMSSRDDALGATRGLYDGAAMRTENDAAGQNTGRWDHGAVMRSNNDAPVTRKGPYDDAEARRWNDGAGTTKRDGDTRSSRQHNDTDEQHAVGPEDFSAEEVRC